MLRRLSCAAALLALTTVPTAAHLNPGEQVSVATGFSHPLLGVDHILAMIAVGLWAYSNGGKGLWVIPSAFVGTMLFGFLLALSGFPLPFVEPAILASVLALGLLVAVAVRMPLVPSATLVGVFALFHGYAHGGEIGLAGEVGYAAGFAAATALLHALGLTIGFAINSTFGAHSRNGEYLARVLGGLTSVAGVALFFA
ncbi:HupE/UreJ family protein [Oricola cellulosilytica]|uniref:HupE/UreJ family protein n=1 Tax=Oricola cellulosilytica TaxID=1429082 RepID=A0A4R0PBK8_9HYPH|nr:HupE/UreJ family protein [Oricola cellulosilytica]TCD14436.1 HupE/UreJ family protein [Oricola cellulosilytica]